MQWRDLRPWPVYLLAAAVPVSMALTSLGKALVLVTALGVGLHALIQRRPLLPPDARPSTVVLLGLLFAAALSLAYTAAPTHEALTSLVKHGKLLVVPACLMLLQTLGQARTALAIHLSVQSAVLLMSIALGLGWEAPFLRADRNAVATVFSSYLDQSIMTAGLAAMAWHLRPTVAPCWRPLLALLAVAAVANVLLQLPGRTGQVAAMAVVALAVFWGTPVRWRLASVAAPLALAASAALLSPQFGQRMAQGWAEAVSHQQQGPVQTSSGMRLLMWESAARSIAQQPLTGHGVGAWSVEYPRHNQGRDQQYSGRGGNPHQEFLHWGVSLGLPGMALLLTWLLLLARTATAMQPPYGRATLSLLAVLTSSALFNSILFDDLIGDYFCVMLGVLLACGTRAPGASTLPASAPSAADPPRSPPGRASASRAYSAS